MPAPGGDQIGLAGPEVSRRHFLLAASLGLAAAAAPSLWALPSAGAAVAPSPTLGTTLNIVAHEDDDVLFLNPDICHDIRAGLAVRTIYVTAGDAGSTTAYWRGREAGSRAAYATMAGVNNLWAQGDAGIPGHPAPVYTLVANPAVSLIFLRLPDGTKDGTGWSTNNYESLQKLWTGAITAVHPLDGAPVFTKAGLVAALGTLIASYAPDKINSQDFVGTYGDGDHSDHHSVGYIARDAQLAAPNSHAFFGYQGYRSSTRPPNLSTANATTKQNVYLAYAKFDPLVCQSASTCGFVYVDWWSRRYILSGQAGSDGNIAPLATVTASSGNAATGQVARKAVDGYATGYPADYSREWATVGQGSGAWLNLTWATRHRVSTVVLCDRPNTNDQITAASIVFSDGSAIQTGALNNDGSAVRLTFPPRVISSLQLNIAAASAATVDVGLAEIRVYESAASKQNIAGLALVTGSSEQVSTSQLAVKAIDGYPTGYPGDYTHEWATSGEGAGAWLDLAWATMFSVDTIVLYDRPNPNDHITASTILFSDGSSIQTGPLNDDGSATTFAFPTKHITSLQLMITGVSATTADVGLAEIEVHTAG